MIPSSPGSAIEFLDHYTYDSQRRWSSEDLQAQERFVADQKVNGLWLDWSTSDAALMLLQTKVIGAPIGTGELHDAILAAGPVVELVAADKLVTLACTQLPPNGRLIGIIPCLRDNSPESVCFAQLAADSLWPYQTAEELLETLREAGLRPSMEVSRFTAIPRFNEAVLRDELRFKGFRNVFRQIEKEGYDPMEVGWGEFRFVAVNAEMKR